MRIQLLAGRFAVQTSLLVARYRRTRDPRRLGPRYLVMGSFLAFRFSQGFLVTGDHDPETTTEDRAHRDPTEHRPDRYSPRIISQPTQHAKQLGGEQDMRGVREPARVRGDGADASPPDVVEEAPPENMWCCAVCTYHNAMFSSRCVICTQVSPPPRIPGQPPREPRRAAADAPSSPRHTPPQNKLFAPACANR